MTARPAVSNRIIAGLMAAIVVMLGLSVPIVVRAQAPLTGREVATGVSTRCPDKVDTLDVLDASRTSAIGQWITIDGPLFGKEPTAPRDRVVAHAVDPRDPMRQFASNGRSIERTVDGGCTWSEVHFVAPATPSLVVERTGLADAVLQLAVAEGGPTPGRVWALVGPLEETVGAIRVFVSEDGGDTWQERSDGLPAVHTRTDTPLLSTRAGANHPSAILALAPSDPNTAYIGLSSTVEGDGPVLSTTDGGFTWSRPAPAATSPAIQGQIAEIAVDPRVDESVWMLGFDGTAVMHSADGARSWRFVSLGHAANMVRADGLHVSRTGGAPHVQVVGTSRGGITTLYRSRNGVDFAPTKLAEPIRGDAAVSHGGPPNEMVMSTDRPDQAFALDLGSPGGSTFRSIVSPGLGDVDSPQADRTADPVQWFRRYNGLAAFVPRAREGRPPPPPPRVLPDRLFERLNALRGRGGRVPGELSPNPLELRLPEQGTEAVDYTLSLPPLPTPVDVWFLMDTSGSMGGAIEGLQLGVDRIVKELKAAGLDAWFGLAEYKGENYRYVRLADIAPPGAEFEQGLRRLYASGGGEETQYTALYQSVTSAGQDDVGISPGQGASFRPEALKIIVHASDEPFGEVPDGPTPEEAGIAMNEMGVYHVGLDLSAGAQGVSTAPTATVKEDMDEMARATNTFAPIEGVDCNGDGEDELEAGEPLTCPIVRGEDEIDIAQPIISAVRAVRDDTAVALTVEDAGGMEVVIEDPVRTPVNVKTANDLPFNVRFTCPSNMDGDAATVKLLATVRGADSAQATAKVTCGTPPPAIRAVPAPLAPIVPFIATPPQLVPELETALSPLNQPSPSHVATPSAQPGIAAQPGQVATAQQKSGRSGPPEPPRETSSRDSAEKRDGLPSGAAGTLGAGAAMAVAFGGWAIAQTRSRRPVRQRA